MDDLFELLRLLDELAQHDEPCVRGLFDPERPAVIARAPGRLDVIGGIADYSGSLVLEMPIREAAFAVVQRRDDDQVQFVSLDPGERQRWRAAAFPLAAFVAGEAGSCEGARRYFERHAESGWAGYLGGCLSWLCEHRGLRPSRGLSVLLSSWVPSGRGVSSSAAIEVATMLALSEIHELRLEPVELALGCQQVENLVVGAPCGVMDQMTAALGREGSLLALLCQPAIVRGYLDIPAELGIWGIDSGLEHRVSGDAYTATRIAAFMGYRLIAAARGWPVRPTGRNGLVHVDDPMLSGYLANLSVAEFVQHYRDQLPERLRGSRFLADFAGTTDPVTTIDPARDYPVRQAASHPVFEHERARQFASLLGQPTRTPAALGELLCQSHTSYSACGLGSPETDALVRLVREAGAERGLYGAKVTGGGSGGTVAVLGRAGKDAEVERVAERYAELTGRAPYVFRGSSPGAIDYGCKRARFDAGDWQLVHD